MSTIVITGTQWGDEGKGKIVDYLASKADTVVRFQGGCNAGHTVVADGEEYKLRLLPSGILYKGTHNIIANGVAFDPEVCLQEMDAMAARGIDSAAHRGAQRSGRTAAVLGCGVDISYPPENRRLLAQIIDAGGVVLSEYAPGTQPLPAFFPARNRIISGLSEGVLVVEAARRSGSLITAEMALSEGRDVYAVPGSIYSPQSGGCHNLIRAGARLVESPHEILEDMNIVPLPKRSAKERLTPEEARIYKVLSCDHSLTMDEIMDSLPDTVAANIPLLLLQMQLKGIITENEMHAYRRLERN